MSVGPHERHELKLMKARTKPLSMFLQADGDRRRRFPEHAFDALVARGKLHKVVSPWTITARDGKQHRYRRVLYALPGEEWRINAFLLVQELYDSLVPGWRPDLERILGLLLGYDRKDIEAYIARLPMCSSRPTTSRDGSPRRSKE